MAKKLTGGGIQGNKVRKVGVKYGGNSKSTNVVSPAAVNQMGVSTPFPKEKLVQAKAPQVPLGNVVAGNVGQGGPGKGRTLYGQSGFQGFYNPQKGGMPTREMPKGKDILKEYGPEATGKGR